MTIGRPVFGALPDDVIKGQTRGQGFFVWDSEEKGESLARPRTERFVREMKEF
jgi:hypothetical protein